MGFSFDYLFQGFATALSLQNLFWALVGCFIGTLVGVLPGIGPASGIAILLPLTTVLPPTSAIIMMAAIYYGAMYGGSTTAIVVNIPGEASSVPTAIDGYEMAKQGKAGPALAICRHLLLCCGNARSCRPHLLCPAPGQLCRGLRPAGIFCPDVHGVDPDHQPFRPRPSEGGDLHGHRAHDRSDRSGPSHRGRPADLRISETYGRDRFHQRDRGALRDQRGDDQCGAENHRHQPGRSATGCRPGPISSSARGPCSAARVSVSSWGSFPGCTPSVTTFVAYDLEKRVSKHPERFGHGAIEGVAAPEGANNATSTAGFIPLFSFGLPTAPSMAVLLGGLMMYGLQPGPMLFKTNPEFVWAVIASMYIGNVMLIVLNLPLVGMWARICVIPFYILGPLIIFFSVLGTYSIRFLAFDVWVMLLFGVIGYFMRKLGFPIAPMVLATVIAQMMETSLGQIPAHLAGVSPHLLHPPHLGRVHGACLPLHRPGNLDSDALQSA